MEDMHFASEQRETQGVAILDFKGQLTLGPEDVALRQLLQSVFDAGTKSLILNLRDISSIDTAAVGSLVMWAQEFHNAGGRMALLNVLSANTPLHDLLKLDTVIPTYTDELDAVNSFFPDRTVPSYDLLEFLEKDAADKTA
jgi:anti-sigma B factor antagonist